MKLFDILLNCSAKQSKYKFLKWIENINFRSLLYEINRSNLKFCNFLLVIFLKWPTAVLKMNQHLLLTKIKFESPNIKLDV